MDIEQAIKLKEEKGYTFKQLGEVYGISGKAMKHRIYRFQGRYNEQVEKQGEKERVPKITEYDDHYVINNKYNPVTLSKEQLRYFKELYCIAKMTINQCSRELEIPRTDLTIVIDAFKITHDDTPFIDEDFNENSVDELVDKALIQKKKVFFVKFEQRKYADIEKRIKEYDRKDYLFNKALDSFNYTEHSLRPLTSPTDVVCKLREGLLTLSDWHVGMTINTYLNTYNYSIAKSRVERIVNETLYYCNLYKIDTIVIEILGDMIHGLIHKCNVGAEFDIIEQYSKAQGLLLYIIESLSETLNVRVCSVYGNHARMTDNKHDAIDTENFERLLPMQMRLFLKDNPKVMFVDNPISDQIIISKVAGNYIGASHGDKDNINAGRNFNLLYDNRIEEVHLGHRHTLIANEEAEIMTYYCRSLCGMDDNSFNIRKKSRAGQTLRIYNEHGLESTIEIQFRSEVAL